ncbi:MAG: PRC-barrel domain-containing protein [Sphingomicrobium sp.]|jgi:sporulation protein YlmC with PRC-barrel domain
MISLVGWIATIATMIAAMMTASNLGARVTGWGFVVFSVSSVCWTTLGYATGQTALVATNGFLMVTNLVGIWRWLGQQTKYEDGGRSAETASQRSETPNLFTATGLIGMAVDDKAGMNLGRVVEALIECATGRINYVVVSDERYAGLEETLRAVPLDQLKIGYTRITMLLDGPSYLALPGLKNRDWPAYAPVNPQ